jgi:hypothetical protein
MVVVKIKGQRGQRQIAHFNMPIIHNNNDNNNKWTIRKQFRLNPHTGADQSYNPDYYREMIRAGSIEGAKIQNWTAGDGEKIRAVQTMLHLQTNYNRLLMAGLYRQDRAVIVACLRPWYDLIAREFPQYRSVCEYEFNRHLARYDQKQGFAFQFVA